MSYRILLVEKDLDTRSQISQHLIAEGHKVAATKDTFYALEYAQYYDPDLIIIDIPALTSPGAELLRTYRQSPLCQVPVIILSKAHRYDLLDLLATGPVDYLAKPFYMTDLIERVKKNLHQVTTVSVEPFAQAS